jgi:hypothetical protein
VALPRVLEADHEAAPVSGSAPVTAAVVVELEMPAPSADALKQLAAILRGDQDDPLAWLVEDALRTFVWIVRQQAAGRQVIAVPAEARAHLETCPEAPGGTGLVLVDYCPPAARERLAAWIEGDAP